MSLPKADKVRSDMSKQPATKRSGTQSSQAFNADEGMRVLSYILAGLIFYGGLGWIGDYLLHTGFLLPTGLIIGLGLSLFVIIRRYGSNA